VKQKTGLSFIMADQMSKIVLTKSQPVLYRVI
jgi:hypothetical protein